MTTKTGYSTKLAEIECGNCHVPFAIPENLDYWARKDGRSFYCPNGDRISYRETEIDLLRKDFATAVRQRDAARVSRDAYKDQAETAERRRRAAKGQLTKTRNRIANGVCPCCNRSFPDLAAHMTTKHPDYREEKQ